MLNKPNNCMKKNVKIGHKKINLQGMKLLQIKISGYLGRINCKKVLVYLNCLQQAGIIVRIVE